MKIMKPKRSFSQRALTAAVLAAVSLPVAAMAQEQEEAGSRLPASINIQSQPIGDALNKLAQQLDLQITLYSSVASGINSRHLEGNFSSNNEALDQMLKGTGLVYRYLDERIIMVTREEEAEAGETEREPVKETQEVAEEIIVTGSAIRNIQPTSQMKIYTAEDIARLGVGSTEDFIRKLPQNFSKLNSFTPGLELFDSGGRMDAIGSTAADLGGLGNDATLILINGKRTAQSALFEGGVVNLANIPISAIERIEILLDGASSRYGSDAVGGVINFITRKNHVGAETAVRYEAGRNGSNTFRLNQLFGYNWGTGGVSGTLSYRERKPVDTFKLDALEYDHTDRGGSDWKVTSSLTGLGRNEYPLTGIVFEVNTNEELCASFDIAAFPGACEAFGIDRFAASRGDLLGALPADSDGVNWTLDDLSPDNIAGGRFIPRDQGVLSEAKSVSFSANQDITDRFNLYTEFTYTVTESTNRDNLSQINSDINQINSSVKIFVPEENPFNNGGQDLFVFYTPATETFNGDVPLTSTTNEATRTDLHVGFTAELPFTDWQARFDIGYSRDESESGGLGTADRAPTPFSAATLTEDYIARHDRYIELLNSTDPAIALNMFGNGSVQSPFLADIYGNSFANNPKSLTRSVEAQADGSLFSLPGGDVRMAVGVEYRDDERDYSDDVLREGAFQFTQTPNRSSTAAYTEFDIPLTGENNALPGVQSLQLNIGFRWEEYKINDAFAVSGIVGPGDVVTGPDGMLLGVDSVIYERTGQHGFSNVSPRIGLRWQLVDDFSIQASWGESFRAPNFTELLGSSTDQLFRGLCVFDPDDPRPEDMRDNPSGLTCGIAILYQANPDLKPEIATTTAVGFEWAPSNIDGLSAQVNFRKIDFNNRIASISDTFATTLVQEYVNLSDEFVVRRDDGRLNYFINKAVNFTERKSEVIDFTISYDFSTALGDFRAALDGVYTATLEDRLSEDNPIVNRVGTNNGPEDWRGRLSLSWLRDPADIRLFVNYSGSYENQFIPPGSAELSTQKVQAYWTVDMTAGYDFGGGWRLEAGSNNLTNNLAPFYDSPLAYDPRVYNPTGRNVYAEVKRSFDF